MNLPEFVLLFMSVLVSAFALVTLWDEYQPVVREFLGRQRPLTQTGDSSLGPHSVHWLGATAFAAAVLICFVLG